MIRKCKNRVKDNTQIFCSATSVDDTDDPNRFPGKKRASAARLDAVSIKRNSVFSGLSLNYILCYPALNGGNAFP